jgi:hypothetical protein
VERRSLIVRRIWAACLLLAGANHARILVEHGLFWDYHGVGLPSAVYWSSLTILDPLVALLLFVRPKIGIPGTVLLIATNVAHNLAVTARSDPGGDLVTLAASSPGLVSQILFLIFVAATAHIAWKGVARPRPGDVR